MPDTLLHSFVTLFVTADPISYAPVFLVLTQDMDAAGRRRTAVTACFAAGITLAIFALVGEVVIAFLGISLPAFRVAGGILLFVIAFDMVFDGRHNRDRNTSDTARKSAPDSNATSLAIFPLAIPLIAGPGAMSAAVLLASRDPSWPGRLGLIGVIAALMLLSLVVLLMSGAIQRVIGDIGRLIISRINGVILAALAIQFVYDGIHTFIEGA